MCLQKGITSQGCQTQWEHMWNFVILSVPFPEVQNRKGTESGRCQRTFKEYRHSKILVPIPTCGIFPCWIAVHRIDNAGDLFLFETKSGMYKFSQKCTKGLKNVQNLDARLFILWFLRQKCAYFAIFETQLRDGEFDHQKDSAIFGIHNTSQTKVNSFSVCRHRQFLTSDDLNVRKFQ